MNKERRSRIENVASAIRVAAEAIQEIMDAEQEYFDNMPESILNGDRGQMAEAAISALEEALTYCEEIDGFLTTAAE